MIVVDSFGWIEYFTDGPLADDYEKYLNKPEEIITPSIVVYEVYKKIRRERGQRDALIALDQMKKTKIIPLDDALAAKAADTSLTHGLAMADSIVYTTGLEHKAGVITSDADLKDLPEVIFLPSNTGAKPPRGRTVDRSEKGKSFHAR